MRFSSFLPLAVLVAAASVAVARPVDDYMLASRSDADISLSARDLQLLDYLVARSDADLSLSARSTLDIVDLLRREYLPAGLVARNEFDQPQREHYKTFDEYEKAWLQWNKRNRKLDQSMKKATNAYAKQYQKQQGGSKGILGKLFGKKKQ